MRGCDQASFPICARLSEQLNPGWIDVILRLDRNVDYDCNNNYDNMVIRECGLSLQIQI
jgi:hypothetical protein